MNKKEHIKLVFLSLKYDIDSWNYSNVLTHWKKRLYNNKLGCNVWVANFPFFLSIHSDNLGDIKPLYKLNIIEYIKILYYCYKIRRKNRKKYNALNVKVNEEYQTYLNRFNNINDIIK